MSSFDNFINRNIPQDTGYLYSVNEIGLPEDFKFRTAVGNNEAHGFDRLYGISKKTGLFDIDYNRRYTPYGVADEYLVEYPFSQNVSAYVNGNLQGVNQYGVTANRNLGKNANLAFDGSYSPDDGYNINAMYTKSF